MRVLEEELDLEDGQWEEIHVIAGALKLFFRELPEPLFPYSFFEKFIAAIREWPTPALVHAKAIVFLTGNQLKEQLVIFYILILV